MANPSEACGIVEYFGHSGGHRCGYCLGSDTNHSHGMWSHALSVQNYQDLIDRGWRRSGKYCYKPIMDKTCCPHYTIKCDAIKFKMSKSHKKVIKSVNKYLIHGIKKGEDGDADNIEKDIAKEENKKRQKEETVNQEEKANPTHDTNTSALSKKEPQKGLGPDPNRPPKKKAKELRKERKQQKLLNKEEQQPVTGEQSTANSLDSSGVQKKKENQGKTLEDFLNEPYRAEKSAHKLEIKLVRSSPQSEEFKRTFKESHTVYHKYQTVIHKDPPSKPHEGQFTRFLVDSPLEIKLVRSSPKGSEFKRTMKESHEVFSKYQMKIHHDSPPDCDMSSWTNFLVDSTLKEERKHGGIPSGYGSFHQHYVLDGKIIAVGVIDILPTSVSSVYLYYDPDYSFLSLGTYSALREISFTRSLHNRAPDLVNYYMGYYIHSCPKMRYKGQYDQSYLLCPETYTWHPIEKCVPLLDTKPYNRFAESDTEDKNGSFDINEVLVLYQRQGMPYNLYKTINPKATDDEEVEEYANLVGGKCAQSILLFRRS